MQRQKRIEPGPGQESVWDYPRPPRLEDSAKHIQVVSQGEIVAKSLVDYLHRHPEMEQKLTKNSTQQFFTTSDDTADFDHHASLFFSAKVQSEFIPLK